MSEKFMALALALAERGKGRTSPNPMVGAVIVKSDKIVGQGHHKRAGLPHAEIAALKMAKERAKGGTLYVNLEPCCHYGRTPPCTDAVIESGIKRVVIGMRDPNPLVSGKGIRLLQRAGIEVVEGVLKDRSQKLNESYIKFMKTGMPFVLLKAGESLDGKIATAKGESRWITCKKSREFVHRLRNEYDAVMVGIHTIIKDNPSLTTRLERKKGRNPKRIIVDSSLRIPMNARVLDVQDSETYIATTRDASEKKRRLLEKKGVHVLLINKKKTRVNLRSLMQELGKKKITSVLIEGGGEVNFSALADGIVNRVMFFIAPLIIGGRESPSSVSGEGFSLLKNAVSLKNVEIRRLDRDVLVEASVC
jgi:diaminohydroxyphosphoribosylaminopyrimidine deaminase/5-amino-6-(5-phosphoribosylamino)uracil reductase